MVLRVYNTLTRKKEVFKPITPGLVRFYSCGQTVYDDLHIGNARAYSNWDVITRYLRFKGYDVLHVQNFTDVGHLRSSDDFGLDESGEDKIGQRARERGVHPMELVEYYIKRYFEDTDALNIKRANIYPRATAHIPEMIEMIQVLLDKGLAYEVDGNVYYDTSKFKDYGKLARLSLKDLKAGARVEVDKNKKNPRDFALWLKAAPDHIMRWRSPWSVGYPGWHIECSVMSIKYLGEQFDVHAGGVDHIPVHHTNEIAQSEGYTGKKPWVKYWLHGAFLTINGKKMSKSKGNFFTARELIQEYGGDVVRYFLVSSHYRKQIDFTTKAIKSAQKSLYALKVTHAKAIKSLEKGGLKGQLIMSEVNKLRDNFIKAMDDDFNTPEALKHLHALSTLINKNLNAKDLSKALKVFVELSNVLAIKYDKDKTISKLMEVILEVRDAARQKKDYETTDLIRKKVNEAGIRVEDDALGSVWIKLS